VDGGWWYGQESQFCGHRLAYKRMITEFEWESTRALPSKPESHLRMDTVKAEEVGSRGVLERARV
jgi:hypothetical protein